MFNLVYHLALAQGFSSSPFLIPLIQFVHPQLQWAARSSDADVNFAKSQLESRAIRPWMDLAWV